MTQTWFVTGTSSGIGRRVTEVLLERGDRVAATLRKPEQLEDLSAKYGKQLWTAQLDVSDTDSVRRVVSRAFADLGRIDVVLSNAAQNIIGAAEEFTDDQIRTLIDTNLIGAIQVARASIPHLRSQGGGRLLQISSFGGHVGIPAISIYTAAKWAIEGFYESLQTEVAPFGIGVTILVPGVNDTKMPGNGLLAPGMPAYTATPVAAMRDLAGSVPVEHWPSDLTKVVQSIIDSAVLDPAPLRVVLGTDAYAQVHDALTGRLAELELRKDMSAAVATVDA